MATLAERFWSKVEKVPFETCWLWTGALNGDGHGNLRISDVRSARAHRLSYEMHKGAIPKGMEVKQSCLNRLCVNPDHLEAVGHQPIPKGTVRKPIEDRMLEKMLVGRDDGCWEWTGSRSPLGYGAISHRQVRVSPEKAHRVSYQMFRGDIPAGLSLDHLCRHPWCVNPSHLEPVTHRENILRAPTSVGARTGVCRKGHADVEERPDGEGFRCMECARIYTRAYYRKALDS